MTTKTHVLGKDAALVVNDNYTYRLTTIKTTRNGVGFAIYIHRAPAGHTGDFFFIFMK